MIAENTMRDAALNGGNYYAEGVYCSTDVRRGVTKTRAGTRLACLTTDFLVGFRRAIVDETGPAADTVFQSVGKKWGGFLATRFDTEMSQFHGRPLRELSLAKFQTNVQDMFSHHGWGLVKVDLTRHDQGLVVVTVGDPIFASLVKPGEKPDRPVDSLMAGTLGGFFAAIFRQDLDCVQTKCKACGHDASVFLVALASRVAGVAAWQDANKTHDQILKELANVRV